MTGELTRREVLGIAATIAVGAAATAAVSTVPLWSPWPPKSADDPYAGPTGNPMPTRTAVPTETTAPTVAPPATGSPVGRPGSSVRPVLATSYGPNGTHFPVEVAWPGERFEHDYVVDADWTIIARTLQGLEPEQVDAGVVIRVRPGTLPGGGDKSSSTIAMGSVGDPRWTRNVLICPEQGYGTVVIDGAGIRLDQCARISLFGFVSEGGLAITRCLELQIGWGRFSSANVTRGGRNIAFYEVILGFRRDDDDTSGVRPTETYEMSNISRYGCVYGPSVKSEASGSHCDTVQIEGTGELPFGPFTSVDCVDYGSSNAAELLHSMLVHAEYRHCLVLAGQLPWQVFPLQPGDYQGDPNAFAGGCLDVRVYDSVVAGPVGRMAFSDVQNSRLSYTPQASQRPRSGDWAVDPGVAGWNTAQIMGMQAIPDYEPATLASIWKW